MGGAVRPVKARRVPGTKNESETTLNRSEEDIGSETMSIQITRTDEGERMAPPQRECGACGSQTFYVYGRNGERPVFRCSSCQDP